MEQQIFIRRTKEEVLQILKESPNAYRAYLGWNEELKERFMAFCMGKKTLPVLYDTVFKKLMHPEVYPERLEDCISCLLNRSVKIKAVLPVEDILMDGETLMVMDILVELEDSSLVLVEIQKVPYYFPAERASCYSADLLLRQYSRVKSKRGKAFSYNDLRKVYTIIFYEKTIEAFHECDDRFIQHAQTVCDGGLELNFLQEYYLIALDVFRKSEYAKHKDPKNRLTGWHSFFCTENAEDAEALCRIYPWLTALYVEMARFELNKELIGMFSEMLREMDRNTVRYMVDDMKEQIENGKRELAEIHATLVEKEQLLAETNETLAETNETLAEAVETLVKTNEALAEKDKALAEKDEALAEKDEALAEKDEALAEKDEEIRRLKELLASATK